jgi:hypothetical protein
MQFTSGLPPIGAMTARRSGTTRSANRVLTRRKKVSLFYDLVGDGKQCLRHGEAEYPSGLSVYDEFEPA